MFQLTKEEWNILKSQIATAKQSDNQSNGILKSQNATSSWGGTRKLPYAFTREGIGMLSSVLGSDTAIEMNIRIMRVWKTWVTVCVLSRNWRQHQKRYWVYWSEMGQRSLASVSAVCTFLLLPYFSLFNDSSAAKIMQIEWKTKFI